MLVCRLCLALAALLLVSAPVQVFDHGIPPAQLLQILEQTKFHVVRHIREIPTQPLISAKFLPPNRSLDSFLANPENPSSRVHMRGWMILDQCVS